MDNATVELVMLCAWGMLFWQLSNYADKHWGDGTLGALLAFFGPGLLGLMLISLPENVRTTLSWLPNALFICALIYLFFSLAWICDKSIGYSRRASFSGETDTWTSQDPRGEEPSTPGMEPKRVIHLNTSSAIELSVFTDLADEVGIEHAEVDIHIRSPDKPLRRTYIEALRDALRQYKPFPFWMPTEGNLKIARLFPRVGEAPDRRWCVYMLSRERARPEDNSLAYQLANQFFGETPHAWADLKAEMELHGRGTEQSTEAAADTCLQGIWSCQDEEVPLTRCSIILADIAWEQASCEDDRSDALDYLYDYCRQNPSDADSWIKLLKMLLECSKSELTTGRIMQWNYAIHYLLYACEDQSRHYVEEEPLQSVFDSLLAMVKPDNFSLVDFFDFMSTDEGTEELYQQNVAFLLDNGVPPERTVLAASDMNRILSQPLWGELSAVLKRYRAKNVILLN